MRGRRLSLPKLVHRSSRQEGFTVIEVSVAMFILALLAGSIVPVFTRSLSNVALARQRDTAAMLLNQTLEQIRALPFSTVANGLATTQAAADDQIALVDGNYVFEVADGVTEVVPHGTLGYTQPPLVPHESTEVVNNGTFTISTYPTRYDGIADVIRVTVIVAWAGSFQPGLEPSIRGETVLYSNPTGCLSNATHPFAAPCQPFLYASASAGGASFVVRPAGAGPMLGALDVAEARLDLPVTDATMQIEQTATALAKVATSGGLIEDDLTGTQRTGLVSDAATGDDDPGSASAVSSSVSIDQGASGAAINASDGTNAITVTPGSGDTGDATGTAAAITAHGCTDFDGLALNTERPCGTSSTRLDGAAASIAMTLTAGSTSLGSTVLASADLPTDPTRAFTSRHMVPGSSQCLTASGDGCVHAAVERIFGTILAGTLPPEVIDRDVAPEGWNQSNGLIRLSNYGDRVITEEGPGAASPSAVHFPASGSGSPTLTYWNGSGYTDLTVNWGATPPTISIPAVVIEDTTFPGGALDVTVSADVTLGGTTSATNGDAGCADSCLATASVTSPIFADITYTITHDAIAIANLTLHVDLGTSSARTSYRAAPSAS